LQFLLSESDRLSAADASKNSPRQVDAELDSHNKTSLALLKDRFVETGLLLFGLAIFFGVSALLYKAFCLALSFAGITLTPGWRLASMVALGVALAYTIRYTVAFVEFAQAMFAHAFRIEGTLESLQTPTDLNRPVGVPTQYHMTFWGWWVFPIRRGVRFPASNQERYQKIYEDLHPRERPRPGSWTIARRLAIHRELAVDTNTAGAPWEAVTAKGIYPTRRVTTRRRTQVTREWRAPVEILTLGEERGLARQNLGTNFFETFTANPGEIRDFSTETTGVVRVVGLPEDSTDGLYLRVGQNDSESSKSFRLRATEIPLRYPALRLCVLQCPPAELQVRFSSDRRNAAILKRIGADLFAAGVPLVLVIPALPRRHAETMVDSVYYIVTRRPHNVVPMLMLAVRRFQQKLVRELAANQEDMLEVVYDLCLYAPPSVSFKVTEQSVPQRRDSDASN
jgi:hypothetical protein